MHHSHLNNIEKYCLPPNGLGHLSANFSQILWLSEQKFKAIMQESTLSSNIPKAWQKTHHIKRGNFRQLNVLSGDVQRTGAGGGVKNILCY